MPKSRGQQRQDLESFDAIASPSSSTSHRRFEALQSAQKAKNSKLIDTLESTDGNLDMDSEEELCVICLGAVGASDAIWQCRVCLVHTFHLECVQRWVRDGVKEKGLDKTAFPLADTYWKCPNCASRCCSCHTLRAFAESYALLR